MIHQGHRWTDGQTNDMRSQDRALHYSASRGNEKRQLSLRYLRDVMLPAVARTVCEIFAFELLGWPWN